MFLYVDKNSVMFFFLLFLLLVLLINIAAMDETKAHGHGWDNDLSLIAESLGLVLMLRNQDTDQV